MFPGFAETRLGRYHLGLGRLPHTRWRGRPRGLAKPLRRRVLRHCPTLRPDRWSRVGCGIQACRSPLAWQDRWPAENRPLAARRQRRQQPAGSGPQAVHPPAGPTGHPVPGGGSRPFGLLTCRPAREPVPAERRLWEASIALQWPRQSASPRSVGSSPRRSRRRAMDLLLRPVLPLPARHSRPQSTARNRSHRESATTKKADCSKACLSDAST